jgi:hypothetical protein
MRFCISTDVTANHFVCIPSYHGLYISVTLLITQRPGGMGSPWIRLVEVDAKPAELPLSFVPSDCTCCLATSTEVGDIVEQFPCGMHPNARLPPHRITSWYCRSLLPQTIPQCLVLRKPRESILPVVFPDGRHQFELKWLL